MAAAAGSTHSKIHEVQFAHAHVHVPINSLLTALDGDGEDGVRARAVLVHVCGTNRTFQLRKRSMNHTRFNPNSTSNPFFSEDGKDAQAQQTVLDTEVVAQPRLEVLLPSVGLS